MDLSIAMASSIMHHTSANEPSSAPDHREALHFLLSRASHLSVLGSAVHTCDPVVILCCLKATKFSFRTSHSVEN